MLAGPVASLVSATVGAGVLMSNGVVAPGGAWLTWSTWWVGDAIGAMLFAPLVLIWLAPSPDAPRRHLSVSLPMLAMFLLAVGAYVYAQGLERERWQRDFARRSDAVLHGLRENLDGYLEALYATQGLFTVNGDVDRSGFHEFTAGFLERHRGIRALAWGLRVRRGDRPSFEAAVRREGFADFEVRERDPQGVLVRAADHEEHLVLRYVEPVDPNRQVLGFDIASELGRREALGRARDSAQPMAATSPLALLQDAGSRGAGILVFCPVYRVWPPPPSVEERRGTLRGFVVGVFEIAEILRAPLRGKAPEGFELSVYEGAVVDPSRLLFRVGETAAVPAKLAAERPVTSLPVDIGGRPWLLSLAGPADSELASYSLHVWAVPIGGLLFAALLGALLLVLTGRTAFVEATVRNRTGELEREAAERARATDALRTSEERYRILAEQSSDFIARFRIDGVLTYASPACRTLLGYAPEELVDRSYYDLFHPADVGVARERIRAATGSGGGLMVSYRVLRKDGEYVWLETALRVLLHGAGGAASEVVAVSRDVSERKRTERMRQDLVAMLSHDLKNPLTAVAGFTEILRELPADDPQRDEFLARIEANAHSALTLAMNFVDASRIESGSLETHPEPVFLNEIVEQVLRHQESRARVKSIRLDTRLDRSRPIALLDRRLIDRVVANLVNNAIKFSPAKSEVMVETAMRDGHVQLRIKDQGPGIPVEQRAKLFQRFSELGSGRSDSTGLGLFIVKTLVDAQGGTVVAEFPPEGGSVFEVSFPTVG